MQDRVDDAADAPRNDVQQLRAAVHRCPPGIAGETKEDRDVTRIIASRGTVRT